MTSNKQTTNNKEELNELEKLLVQDEQNSKSSSNCYVQVVEIVDRIRPTISITQPRLVELTKLSNPRVNNVLRKLVDEKKLTRDTSILPYRYYRIE